MQQGHYSGPGSIDRSKHIELFNSYVKFMQNGDVREWQKAVKKHVNDQEMALFFDTLLHHEMIAETAGWVKN